MTSLLIACCLGLSYFAAAWHDGLLESIRSSPDGEPTAFERASLYATFLAGLPVIAVYRAISAVFGHSAK